MNNSGKIQVLIPRNLCEFKKENSIYVNNEGLTPVEIIWNSGFVSNINSIKEDQIQESKILLPRFVESHAHFDKSFTWINYPNLKSNYENALSVNLEEHVTRTNTKILERAEKSINLAIKNGYRAMRTHIDTYDFQDKDIWSELFNLSKKYSDYLKLQYVSLAQIEFWGTKDGEALASKFKTNNGILGGVLVPPFNKSKTINNLSKMLLLA